MAIFKVHVPPQRNEELTVIKLKPYYIETLDMAKVRFGKNAIVNHSPRIIGFIVTRIENGNFTHQEVEAELYTKESFESFCKVHNLDNMGNRKGERK